MLCCGERNLLGRANLAVNHSKLLRNSPKHRKVDLKSKTENTVAAGADCLW